MIVKIYPSVNLIQTRDKENLILGRLAELSVTFVKVHLNISPIDLIEQDVSESDHVQNFPRHPTETLKLFLFVSKISWLRWTCLTLSSWTVGNLSSCRRKRKWGRARRVPGRHRYLTKPTEGWHSFPLLTFLSPLFQRQTLTLFQDFLDFVSADDDGCLEEFLGVKITSWQLQKVSWSKFMIVASHQIVCFSRRNHLRQRNPAPLPKSQLPLQKIPPHRRPPLQKNQLLLEIQRPLQGNQHHLQRNQRLLQRNQHPLRRSQPLHPESSLHPPKRQHEQRRLLWKWALAISAVSQPSKMRWFPTWPRSTRYL